MYALLGLHQFDRALEQAEREAAIAPQSPYAHAEMARIYWIEGRVPDALSEERKAATFAHLPVRPRDLGAVAAVFARSGLRAAQAKSAQLKEKGYRGAYLALDIAHQYGLVEDKGKVLEWLTKRSATTTTRTSEERLPSSTACAPPPASTTCCVASGWSGDHLEP